MKLNSNTQKIWFISDTHFGHKNILKYCPVRNFNSIEEHDQYIIDYWKSVVSKKDYVFHLGDFSFYNEDKTIEILSKLPGKIVLIFGNHDKKSYFGEKFKPYFHMVEHYLKLFIDKQPIILFHFPIFSWDMKYYDSIHLFGHMHGNNENIPLIGNFLDISLDTHIDKPLLEWNDIKSMIQEK